MVQDLDCMSEICVAIYLFYGSSFLATFVIILGIYFFGECINRKLSS